MLVVAVDTSTSFVVAGVVEIDPATSHITMLAQRIVDNPRGHMEFLTPGIVECLSECGAQPEDISAVVVGIGPGPFTGLRVGMATAQAFGDALRIPVHGVESIAALAMHSLLETGLQDGVTDMLAITDARRKEWFWAHLRLNLPDCAQRSSTATPPISSQPALAGTATKASRSTKLRNLEILGQASLDFVAEPAVAKPHHVEEYAVRMASAAAGNAEPRSNPGQDPGNARAAQVGKKIGQPRPECVIIHTKELADAHEPHAQHNTPVTALGGMRIQDNAAHPSALSLVIALLVRRGGVRPDTVRSLTRRVPPLRALYLRRPDAAEPAQKPVPAAVDFTGVDNAQLGVSIQRLDVTAAEAMAVLEKELFAQDSPWPLTGIRRELVAKNTYYFGLFSAANTLVGYVGLAKNGPKMDPEWEIHTMAVAKPFQGRGYSHLLMQEALAVVDAHGGPVFLEVRTDNAPALGLYQHYGFRVTGTRARYYQPSGADAYSMMRPALGHTVAEDTLAEPSARGNLVRQSATAPTGGQATAEAPGSDSPQGTHSHQPQRNPVVLGIESSCDETGVGVVELGTMRLISNRVASSMHHHARFGGVVPEIASRAHLEAMSPVMHRALQDLRAQRGQEAVPDAVAATVGPGLAGALLVGAAAAKAYAAAWRVPFFGVNHLGGHVAVDLVQTPVEEGQPHADVNPINHADLDNAIAVLVSGGHTQILHVRGVGEPMEELGSTLDDAAGEAYDKVARLLGLGYPGGPIIDRLAQRGNPQAYAFPRGMMRPQDAPYDFSFSGLKTAVARFVESAERDGVRLPVEDICASFQEAVCDVLTHKALRAALDVGARVVLLGGGVSANSRLRQLLTQRCTQAGIAVRIPPPALCTDNGVMVAALAAQLIASGRAPSDLRVGTDPSLDVQVPLL